MIKQPIKFALVGMSSGAVNFLVYNCMLFLFRLLGLFPNVDYLVAEAAGFLLCVLWSFCWNRKYVFNTPEARAIPWYKVLVKMYVIYSITGIGLNFLLSVIWVEIFHVPKELLTIINDILGFPITFLLNKFWAFRNKKTA